MNTPQLATWKLIPVKCDIGYDRDYNASRNILITGMELAIAPIEFKRLHQLSVTQVLPMNCEDAPFRAQ